MAHASLSFPIDSLSGKISQNGKVVLRTRNGRTHAYTIERPFRGEVTELQSSQRKTFSEAVAQASLILATSGLRTDWERRFADYKAYVNAHTAAIPRPCTTLRGFIISTLTKSNK